MEIVMVLLMTSDVVWQGIISDVFWLTIFLVAVVIFRRELRAVISSLASFKVAGASFELRDKKATLESYAILTDILVQILSQRDSAEKLTDFISDNSARQLARFTLKYAREVPTEDKEIELLKNVALIVGRKGNTQDAVSFYDALLKQAPDDRDLLNLKAYMLLNSGTAEDLILAEQIFTDLVRRYPNVGKYRFNRSLSKTVLGKFDESISDLVKAIDLDYWKRNSNMLKAGHLQSLRDSRADDFGKLLERLESLQGKR